VEQGIVQSCNLPHPLTSPCHPATIIPSTQGYPPFYQTSLSTGIAMPSYGHCHLVGKVFLDRMSWLEAFLLFFHGDGCTDKLDTCFTAGSISDLFDEDVALTSSISQ